MLALFHEDQKDENGEISIVLPRDDTSVGTIHSADETDCQLLFTQKHHFLFQA